MMKLSFNIKLNEVDTNSSQVVITIAYDGIEELCWSIIVVLFSLLIRLVVNKESR